MQDAAARRVDGKVNLGGVRAANKTPAGLKKSTMRRRQHFSTGADKSRGRMAGGKHARPTLHRKIRQYKTARSGRELYALVDKQVAARVCILLSNVALTASCSPSASPFTTSPSGWGFPMSRSRWLCAIITAFLRNVANRSRKSLARWVIFGIQCWERWP